MLKSNLNRRQFVKTSAATLLSAALGPSLIKTVFAAEKVVPPPPGMTPVSESDPVANAVGYKADVAKIDFKKYPKRDPKKFPKSKDQHCKTCALYTPANGSWGKCQLLTSGVVASNGWCGSWSKKA